MHVANVMIPVRAQNAIRRKDRVHRLIVVQSYSTLRMRSSTTDTAVHDGLCSPGTLSSPVESGKISCDRYYLGRITIDSVLFANPLADRIVAFQETYPAPHPISPCNSPRNRVFLSVYTFGVGIGRCLPLRRT